VGQPRILFAVSAAQSLALLGPLPINLAKAGWDVSLASGHWPSIYNPNRIDYFEQNNLLCGVLKDSFTLKDYSYCIPIDSLWKLHYERHPIDITNGEGWSNKQFNPSLKQELFLYQNYNIRKIDGDYFKDTNLWKILKDVTNPTWIENYRSLKD
jgi:hypothetical protein